MVYVREHAYLFFSIGKNMWTADLTLAAPRFFRDRFASAFKNSERGNWKEMRENIQLMKKANQDIAELEEKWHSHKTA